VRESNGEAVAGALPSMIASMIPLAAARRRSQWFAGRLNRPIGRVEDRRGSLGPVANAPFPIPPGRRRQLPASGSHRT
jgi:hypothetical protein